jgi:hypothetical protein
MKFLIGLAFIGIIGALGMAGVFMLRRPPAGQAKSSQMMRALALRVALSVLLFACILLAYALGWIQPSGVPIGR